MPRHIAIIMDGNGRWAKRKNLPRVAGHKRGEDAASVIIRDCVSRGIEALTLFAFSSENWRRPKLEVSALMQLFQRVLARETKSFIKANIRFRVIGDLSLFTPALVKAIRAAEAATADNTGLQLNIAASYGGRWDIVQACRTIAQQAQSGDIDCEDINEQLVNAHLSLMDVSPPDLFIRTGGEQRISNFLLWQLAYTELFFTDTLWPDFDLSAFAEALADFANRQRRFGCTGEQLEQIQ